MTQKITPFLWFNKNAKEAMEFYASVFKNSKITHVTPGPDGSAMWVSAEIEGMQVYALNGGPHHKLTEAFSFFVNCENQEEVDDLWEKLTADGGQENMCGWLKDKFGLSWQIIPKQLSEYMQKDTSGKVFQAMLKMKKINVAELEKAYNS